MPVSRKRLEEQRQAQQSGLAASVAAARQSEIGEYLTTADYCVCPDHKYRKRVCKHMLAVRDQQRQAQLRREDNGASAQESELWNFF